MKNFFKALFCKEDGGAAKGGRIDSFEVVTLHTSGMRHVSEHEIVMKDGAAEVSLYGIGHGYERILQKRAVCSKEEALKLLNDCRITSWDGFHGKHPKGVLDGTMFRFKATVNGGVTISADGSQNFPRHYRDFTDGLYEILNKEENKNV